MSWTQITHDLVFPVNIGGQHVTKVTLRLPNGRQLIQLEELGLVEGEDPTAAQALSMVQIVSDLPDNGVDELHPKDIRALVENLGPLVSEAMGAFKEDTSPSGENTEPE